MILILIENTETGTGLIKKLNKRNFNNLIIATDHPKLLNSQIFKVTKIIPLEKVYSWSEDNCEELEFVFDLSENQGISKTLWRFCSNNQVPIVYVDTDKGFEDWTKLQNISPFYWKRHFLTNRGEITFNKLITYMIDRY